jgi:hypothetical protein
VKAATTYPEAIPMDPMVARRFMRTWAVRLISLGLGGAFLLGIPVTMAGEVLFGWRPSTMPGWMGSLELVLLVGGAMGIILGMAEQLIPWTQKPAAVQVDLLLQAARMGKWALPAAFGLAFLQLALPGFQIQPPGWLMTLGGYSVLTGVLSIAVLSWKERPIQKPSSTTSSETTRS